MVILIIQSLASGVLSATAGIALEAPKSLISKIFVVGALGWVCYGVCLSYIGMSTAVATFFAASLITWLGTRFSRWFKAPVTIFYIPAFFPYVPGTAIYQMAFHFISGETGQAANYMVNALSIAGAIALGVYITDSMMTTFFHLKTRWCAWIADRRQDYDDEDE